LRGVLAAISANYASQSRGRGRRVRQRKS
jgi:hypothetical protein